MTEEPPSPEAKTIPPKPPKKASKASTLYSFLFTVHRGLGLRYLCSITASSVAPSDHTVWRPQAEIRTSVADPERFDANPDPTFQADADPDLFS